MDIFESLEKLNISEECFNVIVSIIEFYIDAEHDATIERAHDKRVADYSDAVEKAAHTQAGSKEREKADKEVDNTYGKLQKFNELYKKWKERRNQQLEDFKKKMEDSSGTSYKDSKKAEEEHGNAQITQAQRQKLEKVAELTEGILTATNKELKSPRDIYNETTPEVETVKKVVSKKEE